MVKYKNPPIERAIIEIKFNLSNSVSVDKIEELAKSIDEELEIWGSNIEINTQTNAHQKLERQRIVGFALRDKAFKYSLHLNINAVNYTLIDNYDHWEVFEEKFISYWSQFKKFLDSKITINRIGVRFINKINLQSTNLSDVKDYIVINFDESNQTNLKENFKTQEIFQRSLLSFNDLQCNLSKGLVQNQETKKFDAIIDIDAYKNIQEVLDDKNVKLILQNLRKLKNKIFENNIKDKARELFK